MQTNTVELDISKGMPIPAQADSGTLKTRADELLRLILTLSTNFIILPADCIDDGIHDVLGVVGNFASVERCYVFQFNDDGTRVSNTHEWCAKGATSQLKKLQDVSQDDLPWLFERVRTLGVTCVPDARSLPPKAWAEKASFLTGGIQSLLVVPMVYGYSLVGFLGLDSVTEKKAWDEDIISLLKIVGEIFVNALARKRAVAALKISEEKYRNIFENATEGIFQCTPQGRFLSVNPAMARMYGYNSAGEMLESVTDMGRQIYTCVEDYENFRALIEEKGFVKGLEYQRYRKDGSMFWTSTNAHVIRNDEGKTLYYEGTVEDVTSRKDMEQQLYRERETFKDILEKAPYGVALMDGKGTYLYVNPEYTNITGYTIDDILNDKDWLHRAYPDPAYRAEVTRFLKEQNQIGGDRVFTFVSKSGTAREIEFRNVSLDGGRTIITLSDITEKKLAIAALQESEEKFRTLFEDSKDAIYIVNVEGRFVDCNRSFLNLFGYTREEAFEVRARDTYYSNEERRAFTKTILEKGAVRDYPIKLLKKDGTVMDCLLTMSEKKNHDGTTIAYQGIVRDITAFKKAEETIRHMAYHDALTGLPNRILFSDRLSMAMAQARRDGQRVAVAMLDLDKFKSVNDLLGHKVGDFLLKAVANRLSSVLRKSDTVARMGGDEFLLILTEMSAVEDAEIVAGKVVQAFRKIFTIDSHKLSVTTSIGLAVYPEDGEDADVLIRRADIAMYAAKRNGRNKFSRYTSTLDG